MSRWKNNINQKIKARMKNPKKRRMFFQFNLEKNDRIFAIHLFLVDAKSIVKQTVS